jgi:signal transduction histidine kinase
MLAYKLLYLASLINFTFGALSFSILALFYWREQRLRRTRTGRLAFPIFTLVCASAFLINLLLRLAAGLSPDSAWVTGLSLVLVLVTSLLPPLLFHLIYAEEQGHLRPERVWRSLLAAFYAASILAAFPKGLEDSELIATGWSDLLDDVPAFMLVGAGVLGLLVQALSNRRLSILERRHRRWTRALLCLTLVGAAVNLVQPGALVSLLPDYLVLSFFCVTLYYKERLVFFDLLIKRGAFFAIGLVGLTLFFVTGSSLYDRLPADWSRAWIIALLLLPFFLTGPWVYRHLSDSIDRTWLHRPYSTAEAERQFVHDVQASLTEKDLWSRVRQSLHDIFQAPSEVGFCDEPPPAETEGGLRAELQQHGAPLGWITLEARPNCIPYLSDDRRLLQSIAGTLNVVLENVRFREQQQHQEEREQQLRLLASRAELKALRAQMNPHFLFNALNAIAGLIQDQPQLADETVEQLAHVFRYTLRKSENEWVRLDEEIEFVTAYLRVEQARFGDRLHIEFDIDPAAGSIPIPAMSIQPLIENAIKHGISTMESGGKVALLAKLKGEVLCVEVLDNGPGFPPGFSLPGLNGPAPTGHGLRNIVERLRGYYGDSALLEWESAPNATRVHLSLPCRPASYSTGGAHG